MTATELCAAWNEAAAPPPDLTVSEWAEEKRHLPESSGARGGRWRNDAAPYLVGIMDAMHEPGVRKVALMKAAQCGGSEAMHNILGYCMEHQPTPMLLVHPTVSVAEEWSKERLADMIRTTPALRAIVRDKRQPRGSHEGESTLSMKMFPGGFLALGGSNTPNTFARRSVGKAFGDDVDRWPAVVGEEGDPADLLDNRTTTFREFGDDFVMHVSTPALKGGRIDTLYQRSDQRRFVIECPGCGREDWITWGDAEHFRVVFDGKNPRSARLECPAPEHGGCGAQIHEPARRALIARAASRPDKGWRPTAEPKEEGLVGFHLPGMVATLGVTLESIVEKWLAARERGVESLRVFVNTTLAEGWEDREARMDAHLLLRRRENYGDGVEVPMKAVALSAGVDAQVDRFELLVMGWGPAGERWTVDWRTIPGNPKLPETRAALLEALEHRYAHASGHLIPIHATCIDSGFATEQIYELVHAHQAQRIYATKGVAGKRGEPIVMKPSEKRYGRAPRPVRLYPVNVDDAKAEIMGGLALTEPGPGYQHFHEALDPEFFAQLCAEHRETRHNKGGIATGIVWVQDRARNEALDCAVLCLAARQLAFPLESHIRQMAQALAAATPVEARREENDEERPAQPRPRRRSRSSSLSGGDKFRW